jgi:hypothetical protein
VVVVGSLGLGGHAGRPCFIEDHGMAGTRTRGAGGGALEGWNWARLAQGRTRQRARGASRELNLGAPDAAGPSGQRTCFLTTRSHVRSCTAWRLAFVPVRAYSTRIVRHHPFSKTWR